MLDYLKNLGLFSTKFFLITVALIVTGFIGFAIYNSAIESENLSFVDDGICNVAIIPVAGQIGLRVSDSEIGYLGDVDRIVSELQYVQNSDSIKAAILQIDSYGGYPIGPEVFYSYALYFDKPLVSWVREAALSAAYAIAIGTDHIIAGETSDIGSIGSNASFVNSADKLESEGERYVSIVTGPLKDAGTPEKKLNLEDLEYIAEQNDKVGEIFKNWVAKYRRFSANEVEELSNGRSWLGVEAKELGLIDEVGGLQEAIFYLREKRDPTKGLDIVLCEQNWY